MSQANEENLDPRDRDSSASGARGLVRALIAATLLALILASPSTAVARERSGRGSLVSVERLESPSAQTVRKAVARSGLDPTAATDPVVAYRLVYRTPSAKGSLTRASGLLVVPLGGASAPGTLVFEHGTAVPRDMAPSTGAESIFRRVALLDGSAGYVTVAPDYLGAGTGPGEQAYNDLPTEVSASRDMLRAARTFLASRGRRLDRAVDVTGFSQGGAAALAFGHALQAGNVPGFSLGSVAGISGAYDLTGAQIPAMLGGRVDPILAGYIITFLALSWQHLHGIYRQRDEVFQPGTEPILRLFDGHHPENAIFASIPPKLTSLVRPAFLERLAHPTGRLRRALSGADLACDWAPRVPVTLYYSPVDEAVSSANTDHCAEGLRDRGSTTVHVVDVGHRTHVGSALFAVPRILAGMG
jgi:hypothetical protein